MTLNKLRLQTNEKGFTLIELMIVIAIIGILAAIAIPNFISYRDKAFCSAAESDAQSIAGGLADYFSIPGNTSFTTAAVGATVIDFTGSQSIRLSGTNTGAVAPVAGTNTFIIRVTDASNRCPVTYMNAGAPRWNAANFQYSMTM